MVTIAVILSASALAVGVMNALLLERLLNHIGAIADAAERAVANSRKVVYLQRKQR